MTETVIEQELVEGISAIVAGKHPRLTPETCLTDLGIDSLGLVEIFVLIEKKFNLQLMESGIAKQDLESIKTLAAYIRDRM